MPVLGFFVSTFMPRRSLSVPGTPTQIRQETRQSFSRAALAILQSVHPPSPLSRTGNIPADPVLRSPSTPELPHPTSLSDIRLGKQLHALQVSPSPWQYASPAHPA